MASKTRAQRRERRRKKSTGTEAALPAEISIEPGAPAGVMTRHLIVGIGASAGGLQAFKTFFINMPADSGLAFVLVQHLDPQHRSMLVELLSGATAMPVIEAADRMTVAADHVYVIPPNATLRIADGALQVSTPAPAREHRRPIDTFFLTLAEDQKENAVCVILAGSGSDGSVGLRAIKEQGGLTIAQADFDEHAMSGMPMSAAATGFVDYVLSVEEMPAKLLEYSRHLLTVQPRKGADGTRQDTSEHLAKICALLRAKVGHDFSHYKEKTLIRRIQRRMQVLQIDATPDYITLMRTDPREGELLFRELLIGVTHFFRDPPAFEALETQVIPHLIHDKDADDTIRVWIPACATGEEAYSIAILLREAARRMGNLPRFQLFATDIDENAIAVARAARYHNSLLADIAPERLQRWFVADGEQLCPIKEIREMCVFSTHSLIKDPPFSRLDLISCRNLLIYLNSTLQERLIRIFHYALTPGGYLFLGNSEHTTRQGKLFEAQDQKHRIFKRRDAPSSLPPSAFQRDAAMHPLDRTLPNENSVEEAARRVMERHIPAYVVVDRNHEVLRFSGQTDKYIEPVPGPASLNLFNLIRKTLRPAARAGLANAAATGKPVVHEALVIEVNGGRHLIDLLVDPMPEAGSGLFVVAFRDRGQWESRYRGRAADALPAETLEGELQTIRERLQTTTEQFESANEELKSANEEYQSVNEELQSTNEELETSKEEMQSINEELQTVNAELNNKNDALIRSNSDFKNLLDSTQIATLFLDRHLRIKTFTPSMTDLFHLRDSDRGRPVSDMASRFSYDDLRKDAMRVMRDLSVVEREVNVEVDGLSFLMRLRPYRTVDDVIDGVVITFVDITSRRRSEIILREHAAIVEFSQDALLGVTLAGIIKSWNPGATRLFGYSAEEAVGHPLSILASAERVQEQAGLVTEAATGKVAGPIETMRRCKDGREFDAELTMMPIFSADGKVVSLAATAHDITERRRNREQRNILLEELNHRVKNTLATVQSIAFQTFRNSQSREAFQEAFSARLMAVSKTHDLLTQSNWEGTSLRELVLQELEPYRMENAFRFEINGEEVQLQPRLVLAFGLMLHELATNAVKHGALSVPTGRVDISWEVRDGGKQHRLLHLRWVESGGPQVEAPRRRGLGSRLIEGGLVHEFGGAARIDFDPLGVRYVVDVPLAQPGEPP